MYQTQVTTYVQEPKVAAVAPPTLYADYEKEYEREQALIRKKMAKDTTLIRTFAEEQVKKVSKNVTSNKSFPFRFSLLH